MSEPNSNSIGCSVRHWVRALSAFGGDVSQLVVPAGAVVKLSDEFFDAPEFPGDSDWFQLDGTRFEVYLEDGASTIRLANRRIMLELLGSPEYPLITWFGHRPEDYELVVRKKSDDPSGPGEPALDASKLVWVGWAHDHWRTHLFDGANVLPATQIARQSLDEDHKIVWMGWDGEHLDVFTAGFEQVPVETAALFVGADGSIIAVKRKTGR